MGQYADDISCDLLGLGIKIIKEVFHCTGMYESFKI